MAQVTVTIDGKAYRMACEAGQERHLEELAEKFDQYVTHLRGQFGEIGDLRLTVMAGIMITDELNDLNRRVAQLQAQVDGHRQEAEGSASKRAEDDAAVVGAISELAMRLNGITNKLMNSPKSSTN
jgi:cell division protein ZapA